MNLSIKLLFLSTVVFSIGQSVFGYVKFKDNVFLISGVVGVLLFLAAYSVLFNKKDDR
jgi:uncharacterized membrane protein (UPF0136 family)